MVIAENAKTPLTKGEAKTNDPAPLTAADVRALVENILAQHKTPPVKEILSFNQLVTRVPLSARTLRTLIKNGRLPYIRLPGARRLLFDWETVCAALRRFERGAFSA